MARQQSKRPELFFRGNDLVYRDIDDTETVMREDELAGKQNVTEVKTLLRQKLGKTEAVDFDYHIASDGVPYLHISGGKPVLFNWNKFDQEVREQHARRTKENPTP